MAIQRMRRFVTYGLYNYTQNMLSTTEHENARLDSMRRYLDFDFKREKNLQDIVMLAAHLFQSPVSLITLMDSDVQWIITQYGINVDRMPRETSFCTHAIREDGVMVVEDASADARFSEAPLVKYQPNVRFYAGVPLKSEDGYNIGTLCIFDDKPRQPSQVQIQCLDALRSQVTNIMALNMSLKLLRENHDEIERQYKALRRIAYVQSHEVRAPLCNALGVMDLIKMEEYRADKEHLVMIDNALRQLDSKIHTIVRAANLIS